MPPASDPGSPAPGADALLGVVRDALAELHPGRAPAGDVTLDAALDRDLGLDSLGRVALVARIEERFGVALPETLAVQAETPRDLLRALAAAPGASEAPLLVTAPGVVAAAPGAVAEPTAARSLVEVLEWHAARHGERVHLRFDDTPEQPPLTYAALFAGARRVAAGLRERGLDPGGSVVIMLPTGEEYFFAFAGVLLAGLVPVPVYPPLRAAQMEDHLRRHQAILDNCRAVLLVTVDQARPFAHLLGARVASLRGVVTVPELSQAGAGEVPPYRPPHDALAFLQYTSGSTGAPKGVMLTHANLLANIRALGTVLEASSRDVFVSWLPLYHDMGLIGFWLGSLYYGAELVLMSPLTFLARPRRWLEAIHRHRGTLSASPNFGYELCLRQVREGRLGDLDLGSWRCAFNGAEPVVPETLERFAERFAPAGLRREALMPVYGLAECCVGLAIPPLARGPRIARVQREAFTRGGRAVEAAPDDTAALRFVACGRVLPGHELRVVDEAGRELPERREGRVQFRGPSATAGYLRNPEATRALIRDGWLETGDLGYVEEGEIYVTGRSKDVVIRAGRNIYPHELEQAVGEVAGVRSGRVAVFGTGDALAGTERLVVVAETRERDPAARTAIAQRINTLAGSLLGAPPDEVVLAPAGAVLKTSSGKIRRAAIRAAFESGTLEKGPSRVWLQAVRVVAGAALPLARRALGRALAWGYAAWAWAAFGVLGGLTALALLVLPGARRRWWAARAGARALAAACGIRVRASGLGHLDGAGPCVVAANHASYVDALVLYAVLPRPCAFVAKAELARRPVLGHLLARLGTELVERFEAAKGVEDTARLAGAARSGQTLVFFPEGTFTRAPGLREFRLGAFAVAARADIPVVPVAIAGTRSLLREGSWRPRRGAAAVHVDAPVSRADLGIDAGADAWSVAIALRAAARAAIARRCAEPDLAPAAPREPAQG